MLGDLDLMQCAQKDAPTMRRLSVELSHGHAAAAAGRDIPGQPGGGHHALRRLSTSSIASSRSSMSQDSSISPTFSSSMPNSFYLDRVSSLLGRAASMPLDQQQQQGARGPAGGLPSIPAGAPGVGAAAAPLRMSSSLPGPGAAGEPSTRVSALIRSLSKGMDSFR